MENYEKSVEEIKEEYTCKMKDKLEEFSTVKGQKDQMIRDISSQADLKDNEIKGYKETLINMKNNENTLKVQKEKVEKKLFEQCQLNQEIQEKVTSLEKDLSNLRVNIQSL